jgi:hypothetical protein
LITITNTEKKPTFIIMLLLLGLFCEHCFTDVKRQKINLIDCWKCPINILFSESTSDSKVSHSLFGLWIFKQNKKWYCLITYSFDNNHKHREKNNLYYNVVIVGTFLRALLYWRQKTENKFDNFTCDIIILIRLLNHKWHESAEIFNWMVG